MDKKELFYVRPQDVAHEILTLQKDEMHHLTNVHRKKKGDSFLAVDGMGTVYDCQIEQIRHDELQARIFKKYKFMGEPFFKLTLALALPKKGRFEWMVEKGTEIGVSAFMPLLTQRTVVKEKSLKPQRCMRIALAAMKQSQRSVLPTTAAPQKFESFCKSAMDYHIKLLAHEKHAAHNLNTVMNNLVKDHKLEPIKSGILCVGPEGGFTEEEVHLAKKHGFALFSLGPRRLRSETAALVASALILDKMGELQN